MHGQWLSAALLMESWEYPKGQGAMNLTGSRGLRSLSPGLQRYGASLTFAGIEPGLHSGLCHQLTGQVTLVSHLPFAK